MVSKDDLIWWLDLAPTLPWHFASTMPDAPHSYVVRGKTLGEEDFLRAVRVIRTFGQPGKFYRRVNVYLTANDTKWWTMGDTLDGTIIINQAHTSVTYGRQDAVRTASGRFSVYDSLATAYDHRYTTEEDLKENATVRKLLVSLFGAYAPKTLDVGAGTGLLLDLKITPPSLFVGLDPSQGMLNELVRKHPEVSNLIPATFEDAFEQLQGQRFDLVASLFGSPSYIEPAYIRKMPDLLSAGGALVLMHYRQGYLPSYEEDDAELMARTADSREAALELECGGRTDRYRLNNFVVTVCRG
jgi:hypothetical protein